MRKLHAVASSSVGSLGFADATGAHVPRIRVLPAGAEDMDGRHKPAMT
jgi:hypothetical protein